MTTTILFRYERNIDLINIIYDDKHEKIHSISYFQQIARILDCRWRLF